MNTLNAKISGSYDMGKLVNDTKEQAKRHWSPSDIFKDNGNPEFINMQKEHEKNTTLSVSMVSAPNIK